MLQKSSEHGICVNPAVSNTTDYAVYNSSDYDMYNSTDMANDFIPTTTEPRVLKSRKMCETYFKWPLL